MRVLFIGGTGLISSASSELALAQGLELYVLNRGNRALPAGIKSLVADIRGDSRELVRALGDLRFDAVVDWVAYSAADVRRDIELFRGRTRQYIFISSASAYQKPATSYLIREDTPLVNPFWDYSRQKIEAENELLRAVRDEGFPG
jgi:nucleoside-diphosphate-sugar epimerase